MRAFRCTAALVAFLLLFPAVTRAATLTTAAPNNGTGGVFLTLTPVSSPLTVSSFDMPFGSAAGSALQVEVWTRPGSYAGFTASNAGWTLSETTSATSAGTTTFAPLVLTNPINVAAATSVYLHGITVGGGIRYTGTGAIPPQTLWANADLSLFSDTTRTGNVSFAGTQFAPRTFSGNVNYSLNDVPEPSSVLALAGLAGLALRRRK